MPDGWRPILLELELSRGGSRLNPLAHVVGRAQPQQEQPLSAACASRKVARVCMCAMRKAARGHSLEDYRA